MKFVVQRIIADELSLVVMTEEELIRYIDQSDVHNETYQIYNGSVFGEMRKLTYAGWQPNRLIEVVNETGDVVFSGYGTDH